MTNFGLQPYRFWAEQLITRPAAMASGAYCG